MPVFETNNSKLYYADTGEGQPLLLLHGLSSSHAMFYREIEFFKKKYRVIAPDARGHGNSQKHEEYTLQDHIDDTIALLDHLKLDSIYVIGVSMGSYVAQGLAIQEADRVKKLILVATKPSGMKASMEELFDRYADELEGLGTIDKLNRASKYMFHNHASVNQWLKITGENSDQLTAGEQKIASDALKGFDFRLQLDKVKAETLVISGSYDGLNPPEKGRETAVLIPDATFMEFKRSGHAPNVEQELLFLGIADNFLD